jgi:hypothetical protein
MKKNQVWFVDCISVKFHIVVFVAYDILVGGYLLLEQHTASICRVEW